MMLSIVWRHLSANIEEKSPSLIAIEVSFRKLPVFLSSSLISAVSISSTAPS
jgi:hypothetical protein